MIEEEVIEIKICKHCNSNFEITDKDLEFYDKISPVFTNPGVKGTPGLKIKYQIPTPKLCPDCRQQRRLSFRNERKLYHRKCDLTGKQIISLYSPDKPYKIYEQSEWWNDKWSPLDYGVDFDFNKSFFEQFNELILKVPFANNISIENENCDFVSICAYCKDSYLITASENSENCYYGHMNQDCKNVVDSDFIYNSDNCYACLDVKKCMKCFYLVNSSDCYNCNFSINLIGCNDCVMCSNSSNKQYCILNKQYEKEEYEKILKKIDYNKTFNYFKKEILNKGIRLSSQVIRSENAIGNSIIDSKNIYDSFEVENSENIRYSQIVVGGKDLYDCSNVYIDPTLSYEIMSSLTINKTLFSLSVFKSNNLIYSYNCYDSSNLFGCVGIRNGNYCIFNKQYTRQEYENLVPKIIEHMQKTGEWGEFFPSNISPFAYNETVAQEYFPLEKEEILNKGFKWSDYEKQNGYEGVFYEPLDIENYDENKVGKEISDKNTNEILKGILKCEITKKPFKIIAQELEFYRKHNLPIPKRHPDQRHLDRMALRNPRKLFDRKCDKCGIEIKTTYNPERKEIVYCEECYNKEVY